VTHFDHGATIAGLPMYDWPEITDAVDDLWEHIVGAARRRELSVPDRLSRPTDLATLWSEPRMILGQVCSLNPVRDGLGRTEVVGTIIYDPPPELPAIEAGSYASVIVCRTDDDRRPVDEFGLGLGRATPAIRRFVGSTIAANGTDSQSGYWSFGYYARDEVVDGPIFGNVEITGAHRASIIAVAEGAADLAAIDLHSWRLGCEHESAATERLTVVGMTDPTPGVVCVVSRELAHHRNLLCDALASAIDAFALTPAARRLHISGYRPRDLTEFRVVADRVEAAARRPWHR
jgi:ABC transporter, phosphonate, periplasmic substrate-binding protein